LLEDTEEQGDNVLCVRDPGPAANIRFRGESLSRGAVVLPAGKVIGPVEIGTLASVRRAYVHVHQKPLVAILSTGDELVDFHEPLTAGKTMCSNLYSLAAQVLECGARPLSLGIAPDICDVQQCILSQGMHADVIITSGGLSKGKYDLVRNSLVSMGMEMKFQNVLLKPGKPVIFGTIGDRLVFGVPGNPSAAMISFDEFIRPALLKMMGYRNWSGSPDGMPCSTSSFPSCKLMDTLEDTWNDEDGNRRASLVPSRKSAPANGESLNTRHVYGAQRSFI